MIKERKMYNFYGKRNLFLYISLGIILCGIIVNIILGTELDINFKGGTIFSYNYTADEMSEEEINTIATDVLKSDDVEVSFSTDITGKENQFVITMAEIPQTIVTYNYTAPENAAQGADIATDASAKANIEKIIVDTLGGKHEVTVDTSANTVTFIPEDASLVNETSLNKLSTAFNTKYPNNKLTLVSTNSVTEVANELTTAYTSKYATEIVYAYTGTVDEKVVTNIKAKAKEIYGQTFEVVNDSTNKVITLKPEDSSEKAGNVVINADTTKKLTDAFATEDFKDAGLTLKSERYNAVYLVSSNSVKATVGRGFFVKCLFAAALGGLFVTIYLAFRFRKIGGVSAGVFALLALIHDVIIAYLVYVVFRIPLDDNFIAVVLTILGYSLNGTIVIYDRIRENEGIFGRSKPISEIVNLSVNQTFTRNIYTTLATFASVVVICIVAYFSGLDSIISFAFPMSIGILAGCYSSVLLSSPLWAAWREFRQKKAETKGK
ncbi:MAG: hypothetical protein IJ944_00390 [Clostridia bacterium]|nr:hypothetical protein [Clostridia bacterium]